MGIRLVERLLKTSQIHSASWAKIPGPYRQVVHVRPGENSEDVILILTEDLDLEVSYQEELKNYQEKVKKCEDEGIPAFTFPKEPTMGKAKFLVLELGTQIQLQDGALAPLVLLGIVGTLYFFTDVPQPGLFGSFWA